MVAMLLGLVVAVLVFGLIYWLIGLLPIDGRIKTVAYVLLVLAAIVYLCGFLGVLPRWR